MRDLSAAEEFSRRMDAIGDLLSPATDPADRIRGRLAPGVLDLLDRAQAARAVRGDVTVEEVMALVAGASPRSATPARRPVASARRTSPSSSSMGCGPSPGRKRQNPLTRLVVHDQAGHAALRHRAFLPLTASRRNRPVGQGSPRCIRPRARKMPQMTTSSTNDIRDVN
jgi:hypothetical protein